MLLYELRFYSSVYIFDRSEKISGPGESFPCPIRLINERYHYDFGMISGSTTQTDSTIYLTNGQKLRYSLAIFLNKTDTSTSHSLADLDLYVYSSSGSLVASSTTSNNNVEIVDFTASATGYYTIRIQRYPGAISSNTYFGKAWIKY